MKQCLCQGLFMSDTPARPAAGWGRVHVWGRMGGQVLFLYFSCHSHCIPEWAVDCWSWEMLRREKASYSHIRGRPDLPCPSSESHGAHYIVKVSFLHVPPGTECRTDTKEHRFGTWTSSWAVTAVWRGQLLTPSGPPSPHLYHMDSCYPVGCLCG